MSLSAAQRGEPAAYAALRVAFGLILMTHGLPKAPHIPHGSMADPIAASANLIGKVMDLPFAPQLAVLVMLLETIGAAMLAPWLFRTRHDAQISPHWPSVGRLTDGRHTTPLAASSGDGRAAPRRIGFGVEPGLSSNSRSA